MNSSEASTTNDSAPSLSTLIRKATEEFATEAASRLQLGAEQYGEFAYLGNDVLKMIKEELLDTANYAMMQYVKICLIENSLQSGGFIAK